MTRQRTSDLGRQALRLPLRSVDRLKALIHEPHISGSSVTVATAARGLCLVALGIIHGGAGEQAASAFRTAVRDPSSRGIYQGLKTLRSLMRLDDEEPPTVRMVRRVRHRKRRAPPRPREDLRSQPLHLPERALREIEALTNELRETGTRVTTTAVARGLCVLALHLADDDMGSDIAAIMRFAMADATDEGARYAVDLLRAFLDAPPTVRNPPLDLDGPTTDSTPPSFHEAHAA